MISRFGSTQFASPERFHTVDSVETPLKPGRLMRVRPGQVQIWDTDSIFEAVLMLSQNYALPLTGQGVSSNAYRDLDQDSMSTA